MYFNSSAYIRISLQIYANKYKNANDTTGKSRWICYPEQARHCAVILRFRSERHASIISSE